MKVMTNVRIVRVISIYLYISAILDRHMLLFTTENIGSEVAAAPILPVGKQSGKLSFANASR